MFGRGAANDIAKKHGIAVAAGRDREMAEHSKRSVRCAHRLLEMLEEVKEEMGRLEAARSHVDERTNRQAC
jgi:hypothetical protein